MVAWTADPSYTGQAVALILIVRNEVNVPIRARALPAPGADVRDVSQVLVGCPPILLFPSRAEHLTESPSALKRVALACVATAASQTATQVALVTDSVDLPVRTGAPAAPHAKRRTKLPMLAILDQVLPLNPLILITLEGLAEKLM